MQIGVIQDSKKQLEKINKKFSGGPWELRKAFLRFAETLKGIKKSKYRWAQLKRTLGTTQTYFEHNYC
mgnify:CR=1 FL=1